MKLSEIKFPNNFQEGVIWYFGYWELNNIGLGKDKEIKKEVKLWKKKHIG